MQQRRRLNAAPTRVHPMLTAAVAVIVAAAMIAAAGFGGHRILQVQSAAPASADVYSATGSFADGADVVVDDAAVKTQSTGDKRRVVKEFTRDHEFSLFALTWTGERDIVAYVRSQRADGSWSPWFLMDPANPPEGSQKFGTEPIFVEPTKRVQVSTGNVDLLENGRTQSSAPTTARDLEAVFLDGGTGTVGAGKGGDGAASAAAGNGAAAGGGAAAAGAVSGGIKQVADSYSYAMPKVITRAQWGAGNSGTPTYTEPVTAATVHHTAGSNNYTEAEAAGIVRGIWRYHAIDLGWKDIGYNALVDKYGNIYEGRAGGLDRAVEGAHVGGFNQNTWGVSMLGNYQTAQPTPQSIAAMGQIIGWKAAVAGFDPMGSSWQQAEFYYPGSKYRQGQGAMFPNINAHRDFHNNECPGDNLYARMGDIRLAAKAKYNSVRATGRIANPNLPSLPSISNSDGTTTVVSKGGGNAANVAQGLTNALSGLASGDPATIAKAAGTLAGAVFIAALHKGVFDDKIQNLAGTEIVGGLTVKDITPLVAPILTLAGSSQGAEIWTKLEPQLGQTYGAVSGLGGKQLAFYAGGVGVRDSKGEIYALAGKLADAWLQQGLDLGPLGMPTSQAVEIGNGEVRMNFEGGAIVYTPADKTVNIITN